MILTTATRPGQEIETGETAREFLVLAVEVARYLRWQVVQVSENNIIAYIPAFADQQVGQVSIQLDGERAHISSNFVAYDEEGQQVEDPFIKAFLDGLYQFRYYFTPEEIELKYLQLQQHFPSQQVLVQEAPQVEEHKADIGSVKDYLVTAGMIALNIIIFFVMVAMGMDIFEPDSKMMIAWGANFGAYTLDGEWWRLLTSCFLHFGILHLLMNMYALMYIGFLLEPYLGRARFLAAYLLTGIVASLTSLWWHQYVVAAGASGAVFGMYGVLLAMLTTSFIEQKIRRPLLLSIGFYVLYNLAYGMKDGIDNAAHIGGLLSGMLIGYVYVFSTRSRVLLSVRHLVIPVLIAAILAMSAMVYGSIPNNIGYYNKQMKRFSQNETNSFSYYRMPKDTPKDSLLYVLKGRGIELWQENTRIVEGLGHMNLPKHLRRRNDMLISYANLRTQNYELMYRAIRENTRAYDERIEELNGQIEDQLTILNEVDTKKPQD